MDHYNYVGLLKKHTPFYMSGITALILDYLSEVSTDNSPGRQILNFFEFQKKVPFVKDPTKFKRATKRDFNDKETARNVKIIQKGEKIHFKSNKGDITISQFSMDHSLPGASAYIVEHDGRSIIYTGDFRNHGFHSNFTNEFIKYAKKSNPIVIITDGTRIPSKDEFLSEETESDEFSESQVKEKSKEIIKNHTGLLLVNFSQRNLDRILTYYEVAKDCGKIFAITPKMFRYLQKFREYFTSTKIQSGNNNSDLYNIPAEDDENLAIYFARKSWGRYENVDYKKTERKIFENYPHITCKEIKKEPEKYLLYSDYFMMNELIDINPDPGSTMFIHSQTDAFNEEMKLKDEKLNAWLKLFGITRTESIHSSGHCHVNDLIRILEEINADNIIPVHTENPNTFKELGLNGNILLPNIGQVLKI
jgi:ribonuclease J